MTAAGSLRSVSKGFGGKRAVDAVSFDIQPRETLVVLGPSGSGKTTILRMIAGLEEPDAGEIHLEGRIAAAPRNRIPPERRGIAMVFQHLALWPHMTAGENLEFGLRCRRIPRRERARRVGEALDLVDLGGRSSSYPSQLSGGERQRVALARALVLEPSILLLDEPLSDLDRELKEELVGRMAGLFRRLRVTSVYVTHDQEEAMTLADRVLVLHEGRTEQLGTPGEVYEAPASSFVASFMGMSNLIPGEVLGGGETVRTVLGPLVASCGGRPAGARVTVALRPEWLEIGLEGTGELDGVPGTVGEESFRGSRWIHRVRVEGRELLGVSPGPLPPGAEVRVRVGGRPVVLER